MPEADWGCYHSLVSEAEVLAEPLKYHEMCLSILPFKKCLCVSRGKKRSKGRNPCFFCSNVGIKNLRLQLLKWESAKNPQPSYRSRGFPCKPPITLSRMRSRAVLAERANGKGLPFAAAAAELRLSGSWMYVNMSNCLLFTLLWQVWSKKYCTAPLVCLPITTADAIKSTEMCF